MFSYDFSYEDIVNLPHHISTGRKQISQENRAVQFAPFAALTGYEDKLDETARLTDTRFSADADRQFRIDQQLQLLIEYAPQKPVIEVTYFLADSKKSGGAYVSYTGEFRWLDEYSEELVFTDKTKIPVADIYEIEGINTSVLMPEQNIAV